VADDPENAPIGQDPQLDSLESRIASARKAEDKRLGTEHSPTAAQVKGAGMQIASTMVGYPLGGIIVGFALDKLFGTLPWLTIVLMFLAFFGACFHVVRANRDGA
jgi:ATP synthase protein I